MPISEETRRQREEEEKQKAEKVFWIFYRELWPTKRSGNALYEWFQANPEVPMPLTNKSALGAMFKKYNFVGRAEEQDALKEQKTTEAHEIQRRGIADQLFLIAEQEAIEVLKTLMHTSKDDKVRLAAAQSFLDRTVGIPGKSNSQSQNNQPSSVPPPPDADDDVLQQWYSHRPLKAV